MVWGTFITTDCHEGQVCCPMLLWHSQGTTVCLLCGDSRVTVISGVRVLTAHTLHTLAPEVCTQYTECVEIVQQKS